MSVSFWMTSALASEVVGIPNALSLKEKKKKSPTGSKNNSGDCD